MTASWLKILSVALIFCGTLFGAGFASGQEVVRFFARFGVSGFFASIVSGALFIFFGAAVLYRAKKCGHKTARAYLDSLFPPRLAKFLLWLSNAFLVVSFCIMIAGCATLFLEAFGGGAVFGALISLVICYVVIRGRAQGLARFNTFITPFMIVVTVLLCIVLLCRKEPSVTQGVSQSVTMSHVGTGGFVPHALPAVLFSALLYVSYNFVSACAVLVSCACLTKNARAAALGGLLGGFFSLVPLLLMCALLIKNPHVFSHPMPFFSLVCASYPRLLPICFLLLYCAMLTTAASCGSAAVANAGSRHTRRCALLLSVLSFFVAFLPFDFLIRTLYTLFGMFGLVLLCGIVLSIVRKR